MHYLIYKTTNNVNGKIYIGCHKTKNIEDGYLGSGKILQRAIEKYGIEYFSREILSVFDTSKEMFEMEALLVDDQFITEDTNYNIKRGGEGGFDYINNNRGESNFKGKTHTQAVKDNLSQLQIERMKDPQRRAKMIKAFEETRYWSGQQHSEESKQKMSSAKKGKYTGKENPSYGTCWVYNTTLKQNKKISKNDLDTYLKKDWCQGRKMKF